MTTSAAAVHHTPPAIITHSIATLKGQQHADITVHHARTPDARISMTFNGIHMLIYSCHAAQGLLEAFAAARGQMIHLPTHIPTRQVETHEHERIALSVEWTRRPAYAVVTQSALNKLKTARIHWIDLHTGPITWQIRDRAALLSVIELLNRVHKTSIAVFPDGEHYSADPTGPGYQVA
ncbi:hypothetical protein [Mycobacterium intracellulare]|uniref:hypothetical protein n=1 Tax=Mycobacterium intracellulare TaxID=1767 RepID=UPI0006CA78AB|nr:hypothetical protein [Mycobacterium intracellulare]KPN46867.1 hypothetical protein AN933_25420 [Mycobacterium intracellulare subsp. chimaera]